MGVTVDEKDAQAGTVKRGTKMARRSVGPLRL
jgi:hypothetical protein